MKKDAAASPEAFDPDIWIRRLSSVRLEIAQNVEQSHRSLSSDKAERLFELAVKHIDRAEKRLVEAIREIERISGVQ